MRLYRFLTPAEFDALCALTPGALVTPPRPVTPAEAVFGAAVHRCAWVREEAEGLFTPTREDTDGDETAQACGQA